MDSFPRRILTAILIMAMLLPCVVAGRRVTDRRTKVHRPVAAVADTVRHIRGAICVDAASGSGGLSINSVRFTGFDKPAASEKESFLISNGTSGTLLSFDLEITYLTLDGRQLHRRIISHDCHIPAGETRKVDIRSFDTQHSYHYTASAPGRNGAYPFTVTFRPVRMYFLAR